MAKHSKPRNPRALIGLPTPQENAPQPPVLSNEESVTQVLAVLKKLQVKTTPPASRDTLPLVVENLIVQIVQDQTELSHLRALLKQRL